MLNSEVKSRFYGKISEAHTRPSNRGGMKGGTGVAFQVAPPWQFLPGTGFLSHKFVTVSNEANECESSKLLILLASTTDSDNYFNAIILSCL